jgi:hypothetical protein
MIAENDSRMKMLLALAQRSSKVSRLTVRFFAVL